MNKFSEIKIALEYFDSELTKVKEEILSYADLKDYYGINFSFEDDSLSTITLEQENNLARNHENYINFVSVSKEDPSTNNYFVFDMIDIIKIPLIIENKIALHFFNRKNSEMLKKISILIS